MTKREGAVLTAYTGHLLCAPEEFYRYSTEILGEPIFTHEIPDRSDELREKSEEEFIKIMKAQSGDLIEWHPESDRPSSDSEVLVELENGFTIIATWMSGFNCWMSVNGEVKGVKYWSEKPERSK